jgi:hypothetical protein
MKPIFTRTCQSSSFSGSQVCKSLSIQPDAGTRELKRIGGFGSVRDAGAKNATREAFDDQKEQTHAWRAGAGLLWTSPVFEMYGSSQGIMDRFSHA